jgi:hypothetical protein
MRTVRVMKFGIVAVLAATALGSSGCEHMSNTAAGAGIGGALGTGAGLALGAATGNPKTGAVAGGLIGAGVGAAAGNSADQVKQARQEDRQAAVAIAQAQAQGKMGMMDVIHMVQAGHSEQVIINQIHSTGSTFPTLSASDLDFLKASNVPDTVIVAMQNARPVAVVAPRRAVVVQDQPTTIIYERPAPVYVAPAPVFVGGYYRRW